MKKRTCIFLLSVLSSLFAVPAFGHRYDARWWGFNGPWGMVATPSCGVIVVEHLADHLKMIRSDGQVVDLWGTGGSQAGEFNDPHGITLDDKGHVFVADSGNNRVQEFAMDGTFLLSLGKSGSEPGEFNAPEDVAIDSDGDVYVTDRGNHRVQKFSPKGEFQLAWGDTGIGPGRFSEIFGVGVGRDGTVYVVDNARYLVQGFSPLGEYLFSWTINENLAPTWAPYDVMIGPGGDVYVSGWGFVRKYSPDGVLLKDWCLAFDGGFACLADHLEEIWWARGIAVDENYRIYVTDPNHHSVVRFLDNPQVPVSPMTWGRLKNKFRY